MTNLRLLPFWGDIRKRYQALPQARVIRILLPWPVNITYHFIRGLFRLFWLFKFKFDMCMCRELEGSFRGPTAVRSPYREENTMTRMNFRGG